jgi:hypothetical protein
VRRTNGGSWYAVPFRVVPDRGQVCGNLIEAARAEGRNVFHDRVARSNLPNETGVFSPEAGAFAGKPRAFARRADVLAGKAAADDVGEDAMLFQSSRRQRPHVLEDRDGGPVLTENTAGVAVLLTERDRVHPRTFKPEGKAPDA